MKIPELLAGGLLLLWVQSPGAPPTVDAAVDRYIAATGGADKWRALQSLAISSRSPYFSSDAWWKKPNRVRIDAWSDEAEHTDTRSFDGTTGWRVNSLEGVSTPRAMSASEIAELRSEIDWMFELVDHHTKGHKLKLLGSASINGRPAHKVELTRGNGEVVHIFLDQKSGLEVQRIRWARSPAGEDAEFVLPVGDYRPVGDLLLPHRVGQAARTYEVNGTMPDALFQRPGGVSERDMAARKLADAAAGLLPIGSIAPAWELKDPQGRLHTSSTFAGRLVVMDFWATWCVPCHRVMPELQQLHDEFGSRGLVVLGISTSERGGDPVLLMKDRRYTYTLLLNGETIADRFHVVGMPTVYVVGADGRILHADVGAARAAAESRRAVIARHLALATDV